MADINLKGMGVALITPFKEDESVDYEALGRLVDYLLQNGADYLVVLGTTAETPTLTEEEKNLYNEAVARNDNSILNGKKVKTIIEEERQRKETEQKAIEEQKTRQEEINKIEQDSTSNLLEVLYRNFNNYMNAIDTATYTFDIKDINFELIRMYYDNTVEAVNTFKTEISLIEGLEEKNADNILKLDEYIQIFDRATTTTSNIDEFFNLYNELSDKFQVCYEKLFKNVSGGKDIYKYLE